jgi:hypothetical protein
VESLGVFLFGHGCSLSGEYILRRVEHFFTHDGLVIALALQVAAERSVRRQWREAEAINS